MSRSTVDRLRGARPVTTLAVVAVVVLVVAAAGPVALASADTGDRTATTLNETTNETANTSDRASFGAEVSAFMSSSAAATDGTVDQGMWNASVDGPGAGDEALVTQRVDTLDGRLAELREQRNALLAAHANGSMPDVVFYTRLASLTTRIEQLADATNHTAATAHRVGVTPPGLQPLRDAVNETVRGPPAGIPGIGPNDGLGNGDDGPETTGPAAGPGSNGQGNGTTAGPGQSPANGTPGASNGTQGGPQQVNPGNSTGSGNLTGPGNWADPSNRSTTSNGTATGNGTASGDGSTSGNGTATGNGTASSDGSTPGNGTATGNGD